MKNLTIADIAKVTDFSKSTVSAAINGKPGISERNRQIILETIKNLGYEPSELARGLANNQSGSIGLVVSDITNPFFNMIVKAVEEIAEKYNYTVLLSNTNFNHDKEVKAVNTLLRKRVDGIIITPLQHNVTMSHLFEIERRGVPLGVLGQVDGLSTFCIEQDDRSGTLSAMDFLFGLGHRKIGHITGPSVSRSTHVRFQAYKDFLLEHAIPFYSSYVFEGGVNVDDGYRVGKTLCNMKERPTAVFCYNDLTAVGVIKAFNEVGLRVPEDLSIVGFDNIDNAPFPLTTVNIPIYEMGQRAAEYIFKCLLKGVEIRPCLEIVPTNFIVRKSASAIEA